MKSFMTFVGIFAFNLPNISMATDFSCPVSPQRENYTCSGTIQVTTQEQLNSYADNLGASASNPTVLKNLELNFSPNLTSDLVISSPCTIKIPQNITITSTGNVCLHARKGMDIDNYFTFKGKNLSLEGNEELLIGTFANFEADDIKIVTHGNSYVSKIFLADSAIVKAANMFMESFDVAFIGRKADVKLTGTLSINSTGANEASIRDLTKVEANKIEVKSVATTRIASAVTLKANEIKLQGATCSIHTTSIITSSNRSGNCFLISMAANGTFSVDKVQGPGPLTVNFSANNIAVAKGYIWTFGDGSIVNTLTPTISHTYATPGVYAANLKYALEDNFGSPKTAGTIQIDVKAPTAPAIPPRGDLKYQTDGTFVYLRGFIKKGTYDIANAYYVIDDNQNYKIQIPNFYQNSLTNVEMNTYGRHKVTMHVIDVQGLTHTKSMNIYADENESDVYPYIRLDVDQSAARTMFFDMSWAFNPIVGETLKNFTIDFGDGQTAVLTDTAFITHTYAQAGTYVVRGTGQVNGNEDYDEFEIEVTDENTSIMSPVAGFEYKIYNNAGNVVFTDDHSGTPNGEIISYAWDFGDGNIGYGKNATNFYSPGDYLVTLTVTDTAGKRSSQTQKISIVNQGMDIAAILDCRTISTKKLECKSIALDRLNQITRVKLDWGDGEVETLALTDISNNGLVTRVHDYENFGTYNVKLLVDTERGKTVDTLHEAVLTESSNSPTAVLECFVFSSQVNCVGIGSSSPVGNIISYKFDFGNGTIYENTSGDVVHFYQENGNYTITLTVIDSLGQTSYHNFNVNINSSTYPIADLQCTINNLLITCNALGSYDPSGSSLVYEFSMGDGTTYSNETGVISHSYSYSSLFQVKVVVKNRSKLESIDIKNYQALDAPYNIAPEIRGSCYSTKPFILDCDFSESVDDGYIVSYSVKFEDDFQVSANPVFSHRFETAGSKQVSIVVTDNEGKISNWNTNFYVKTSPLPIAAFQCNVSKIYNLTCYAYGNEGDSENSIIEYTWDLGDSSGLISGMIPSVKRTYSPGTYKIKLIVKNQYGNINSYEQEFVILENQLPIASIECMPWISPITDGFYCQGMSYDSDGIIEEGYIMIEGVKYSNHSTGYIYFNGGDTTVIYTVRDSNGAEAHAQAVVSVTDRPKLEYNCIQNRPYHISCNITELPLEEEYSEYIFKVDSADIILGKTLEYDFVTSGPIRITAVAYGKNGKEIIAHKGFDIAEVYQVPKPEFISYVDINNKVVFDATDSYIQDRKIQSFSWNFGDGQVFISSSETISHSYAAPGVYTVSLAVTDLNGATRVLSKVVDVYVQEVPDPGLLNEQTAVGVDVDNDNVRDDIQRWISFESKADIQLKDLLKKLARTYQVQIINKENEGVIIAQENIKNKIESCLLGIVNNDNLGHYYLKMTKHFFKSTKLRYSAYADVIKYSRAVANSYDVPKEQVERLAECSGI